MHEAGLALDILEKAVTAARDALGPDARVESLRVRVGEFSGVDADALGFALEVLSRGGPAENCRVELIRTPLTVACACGRTGVADDARRACPHCGSQSWTVTGGRDLVLEGLEAVEPDENETGPPAAPRIAGV